MNFRFKNLQVFKSLKLAPPCSFSCCIAHVHVINTNFSYIFSNVRFRLEEDIGPRVANGKTREQMIHERSARFSLYEDLTDTPSPSTKDRYVKDRDGTFLDILMYEIPGLYLCLPGL